MKTTYRGRTMHYPTERARLHAHWDGKARTLSAKRIAAWRRGIDALARSVD